MFESPESIKTNPPVCLFFLHVCLCSFFLSFCSSFFLDFCVNLFQSFLCLAFRIIVFLPVSLSSSCLSVFIPLFVYLPVGLYLPASVFHFVSLSTLLPVYLYPVSLSTYLSAYLLLVSLLSFRICFPPCLLSLCFSSRLSAPFLSVYLPPVSLYSRSLSISFPACLSFLVPISLPFSLSSFRPVYLPPVSIFLPISLSLFVCLYLSYFSVSFHLSLSFFLTLYRFLPVSLSHPCLYFRVWGQNVTPPVSMSNPSKTT